jgi:hypothetical protein
MCFSLLAAAGRKVSARTLGLQDTVTRIACMHVLSAPQLLPGLVGGVSALLIPCSYRVMWQVGVV